MDARKLPASRAMKTGGSILANIQQIPPRERAGEYLTTRLRTTVGIQGSEYEKQYLLPFAPLEASLEKCRMNGFANKTMDGRWYLTPKGFLISNSIISDLLLIQDQCQPMTRKR